MKKFFTYFGSNTPMAYVKLKMEQDLENSNMSIGIYKIEKKAYGIRVHVIPKNEIAVFDYLLDIPENHIGNSDFKEFDNFKKEIYSIMLGDEKNEN